MDGDFHGESNKYLKVYHNDYLLATCESSNETIGECRYCLHQYPLPYPYLLEEQVVIILQKGNASGIPSRYDHSLWADVTLSCEPCNGIIPEQNTDSPYVTMEFASDGVNEVTIYGCETLYQVTGTANNLLGQNIHCLPGKDCIIECEYQTGCLLADIFVHTSGSVTLSCTILWSCFAAEFMQTANVTGTDYKIICDAEESCRELSVVATNFNSFVIYCLQATSCLELTVSLSMPNDTQISSSANIYCAVTDACQQISVTLSIGNNNQNVNDGIIHCVELNSCDSLIVNTNSEFTQLLMYQYSQNVQFNNVLGYIPEYDNIVCNNEKHITLRTWLETDINIAETLIKFSYKDYLYPCQDVTVGCGDASCIMTYAMWPERFQSILDTGEGGCGYVPISYVQNLTCPGDCIGLGTESPTFEPTNYPTFNPTIEPTTNPTTNPTYLPSSSPTNPTSFPTMDPTPNTTATPTTDPTTGHPTQDPTQDPTSDPTSDPTDDPTTEPTIDPTRNPTADPTIEPTQDPTTDPRNDPTSEPTAHPTKDPTADPSVEPTINPSEIPTPAPTDMPSVAPTRFPTTSDDYDSYIDIVYGLENLEELRINTIANNIRLWSREFIGFIEGGYVETVSSLEYRHFWIQLLIVGDTSQSELEKLATIKIPDALLRYSKPMLKIQSKIICAEWICGNIIKEFDKEIFEELILIT